MTDLVKRLRLRANDKFIRDYPLIAEAADEIERLETENEQWRKLNSERVDEITGLIHRLREAATEIERLRADRSAAEAVADEKSRVLREQTE